MLQGIEATLERTKKPLTGGANIAERRVGMEPVPDSIDLYLNAEQLEALQTMQYFGWELAFVRRSDLNNIVPVIFQAQQKEYAVLASDGDIIRNPNIGIRH